MIFEEKLMAKLNELKRATKIRWAFFHMKKYFEERGFKVKISKEPDISSSTGHFIIEMHLAGESLLSCPIDILQGSGPQKGELFPLGNFIIEKVVNFPLLKQALFELLKEEEWHVGFIQIFCDDCGKLECHKLEVWKPINETTYARFDEKIYTYENSQCECENY